MPQFTGPDDPALPVNVRRLLSPQAQMKFVNDHAAAYAHCTNNGGSGAVCDVVALEFAYEHSPLKKVRGE